MSIDEKTVAKIARLSRLKVEESDRPEIAKSMNKILSWIEQLNEVDVTGVEPLQKVNDMQLLQRDDIVNDGNKVRDILANTEFQTADSLLSPRWWNE